ncbi:hypothetical protein [Rhizobium leguminosarum]
MQQALIRFLRCGKNISARRNRQILFWTGDLAWFHLFGGSTEFFQNGYLQSARFWL